MKCLYGKKAMETVMKKGLAEVLMVASSWVSLLGIIGFLKVGLFGIYCGSRISTVFYFC